MPRIEVPLIKIKLFTIVFSLLIPLLCIRALYAAPEPLVSVIDAGEDNISIQQSEAAPIEYDSCEMTAYGETLYFEGNTSEFYHAEDAEAEYQRARMAFLFGNYEYAYRVWEPLAYQGYAKAQATLAWMFHTGKGVRKNMQRALAWYRLAADQDHPIAQNNLGVFYEQGVELGKSYQTAAKWYKKAAEVGYSFAQYNLGMLYLKGKGVKKNKNEAIYWLQIASLQGVKQAGQALEKLGQKSAPKDEIHTVKPKKRYHGAPLPPHKTPAESKDAGWIAKQNPEHYTLHLGGSYDLASLQRVAQTIPDRSGVAYYAVIVRGKSWFTLIYGNYENEQLAKAALQHLPYATKKWSPLVRKFSEIQETINTIHQ